MTSGVSFEARCGPLTAGTRAATPPRASALAHRHTLTGITPNACATCSWVAALSWTIWTAASRRDASSPASHANVASPCTHTTPPPSGSDHAHPRGDLRRVARQKRQRHLGQHPAHHPPPREAENLSSIIAEMWHRRKHRSTGKQIEDQISKPATPRNQAAMSGALGTPRPRSPGMRTAPPGRSCRAAPARCPARWPAARCRSAAAPTPHRRRGDRGRSAAQVHARRGPSRRTLWRRRRRRRDRRASQQARDRRGCRQISDPAHVHLLPCPPAGRLV